MQHQLKSQDDRYLNRLFSTFAQFDVVSSEMLKANDVQQFICGLEKSVKVDKRLTVLFLRKFGSKGTIPLDFIYIAQNALNEDLLSVNGKQPCNDVKLGMKRQKMAENDERKVMNVRWKK